MKIRFSFFVLFLLLVAAIQAQTVDELKKQSEKDMQKMRRQQSALITQMQQDFDAFVRRADKDFAVFLKQSWKEFEAFRARKEPLKPKPEVVPHYAPGGQPGPLSEKQIIPLPAGAAARRITTVSSIPPAPVIPAVHLAGKGKYRISVDFYGRPLTMSVDLKILDYFPNRYDRRTVSKWWLQCSRTPYAQVVESLYGWRKQLQLNDWGYYLLVKQVAQHLAPRNAIHAKLLSWFLMVHSGYDMKIASGGGSLFVLFPAVQQIYERKYLVVRNKTYYFDEPSSVNTFQTYDYVFPKATRALNFVVNPSPHFAGQSFVKEITLFLPSGKEKVPLLLNKADIRFLNTFPTVALPVYFHSSMPVPTALSLDHALLPVMENMNPAQRLSFLLHFVQTSFPYETDQKQFGRERFFFPEEALFYPGSDCEDRAVIFSWLVRHFLHLKVIGLVYPDHVATAVALPDVPGDYVVYHGTRYVVADPTYIGAPVGVSMPQYAGVRPEVIPVN